MDAPRAHHDLVDLMNDVTHMNDTFLLNLKYSQKITFESNSEQNSEKFT